MNTWFECTAKYVKMDESGHERTVGETYLLDAVSFTEAESRIFKELATMVTGDFMVSRISKTRISEIIPSDTGDRWYKAKVTFITVDEESGKEKRVSQMVLVFSDSIKEAYDQVIESMQGMMADFEISAISESTILDVFPYEVGAILPPGNFTPLAAVTLPDFDDANFLSEVPEPEDLKSEDLDDDEEETEN